MADFDLPFVSLGEGVILSIKEILVDLGFASSRNEAHRLIEQRGVKFGRHVVLSPKARVLSLGGGLLLDDTVGDGPVDLHTGREKSRG